jgi:hypothetical protein
VGLKFEDLEVARKFMLEEIEMDVQSEKIYLSSYLTQSGQGNWAGLLLAAAQTGSDETLAVSVRGMFSTKIQKRKHKGGFIWAAVPHNANEVLAESEFNRYFCRGLARHATDAGIPRLEVYRAKQVAQPRPESQQKIGLLVDPGVILIDLRSSQGVEPALGIPLGPGSGITLRIPKKWSALSINGVI